MLDEQRRDNCKVPIDKRGTKPRLDTRKSSALQLINLLPEFDVSTSHNGAAHVAFERMKTLGPCDV